MKIAFKNSKILMINGRTLTPVPGIGPEPGLHYVYTSSEGHGSISASPMSGKKDTLITLSNTPDQNYIFSKYTLNNVDLAGSSFLMPDEDAYVRGYFQPDVRTITVTQPSHGTITAPASAQIGSTVTLSCTPDSGYILQYFTVNGSQIQGNSFIMPASDVTVSASIDVAPIVLPTNTIRVKYAQGSEPLTDGRWNSRTLVDQSNNIWDLTRSTGDWTSIFYEGDYYNPDVYTVLEVIAANLTNVSNATNMFAHQAGLTSVKEVTTSSTLTDTHGMFNHCSSLSRVDLFNTENVTDFNSMFQNCSSLVSIPNFDTSNGTNLSEMFENTGITTAPSLDTSSATTFEGMYQHCSSLTRIPTFTISSGNCNIAWMFYDCINVESGMLALYNQFNQMRPARDNYKGVFRDCGTNTVTGQAELAQIPSRWK